jgi:hypothetical protein
VGLQNEKFLTWLDVAHPVGYDMRKTRVPAGVIHDVQHSSGRSPQLPIMLHADILLVMSRQ